ncbi:MAG: thioredoxin domain-containing protein [Caldimonas sp.]
MTVERALVACLCAAWCGSCRDFRAPFDELAAQFADQADFRWVDIEDHADRLGDLDVENFPTLLIAVGDTVRFLGPVAPQSGAVARLIRGGLEGEAGEDADATTAPHDLAARIRALA